MGIGVEFYLARGRPGTYIQILVSWMGGMKHAAYTTWTTFQSTFLLLEIYMTTFIHFKHSFQAFSVFHGWLHWQINFIIAWLCCFMERENITGAFWWTISELQEITAMWFNRSWVIAERIAGMIWDFEDLRRTSLMWGYLTHLRSRTVPVISRDVHLHLYVLHSAY